MTTAVITRKWYTTAEVAEMLGFGLSKTKMLVLTGEIRSALTNAMTEELISKNVAALVKVRSARRTKRHPWSVEEARQFLEAASAAHDPLYAAYVLILVLGFRRGEVLGLTWENVNLDAGEITVQMQLQRINRRLVHDETKTEASTATLPLPEICVAALQRRRKEQDLSRQAAGELRSTNDFVFTTRYGTPFEPRNFNRRFMDRSARAGVRRIRLHDTRHTCGSLLAALYTPASPCRPFGTARSQ
ncbi:tyrosine recombinase XerC [Streptomyces sp. NPDC001292]|uniref:site-specific integrase n=1 Tax=Streptomyces sp. NPDC001292 TaxID=3364558 RepID=UPI0036CD47A7